MPLIIDVMEGLQAKALGLHEVRKNDQVAIYKGGMADNTINSARHVSV